jgi:8-oxo-dGTP pyrophosphatase MutT (NUDIX family)
MVIFFKGDGFERGSSILNLTIVTAGVYVNIGGYFPFQVGPTKIGTTLGVVRLGGHKENGETGWQCASREASEEASITVTPIKPPATYWYESSDNPELLPGGWIEDDHEPILVGKRPDNNAITPIYLARTDDTPIPAMEARGILMLSPEDIRKINSDQITLGQYLESGGKAIFREELPLNLLLEPYPHLRLLETLIQKHPQIANPL